jgi:hypothetical protein
MFSLAFRTRTRGYSIEYEYEYEYHFIEYEYDKSQNSATSKKLARRSCTPILLAQWLAERLAL